MSILSAYHSAMDIKTRSSPSFTDSVSSKLNTGASLTGVTTTTFSEQVSLEPSFTHKYNVNSPNTSASGTNIGAELISPSQITAIESLLVSRLKLNSLKLLSISEINPLLYNASILISINEPSSTIVKVSIIFTTTGVLIFSTKTGMVSWTVYIVSDTVKTIEPEPLKLGAILVKTGTVSNPPSQSRVNGKSIKPNEKLSPVKVSSTSITKPVSYNSAIDIKTISSPSFTSIVSAMWNVGASLTASTVKIKVCWSVKPDPSWSVTVTSDSPYQFSDGVSTNPSPSLVISDITSFEETTE